MNKYLIFMHKLIIQIHSLRADTWLIVTINEFEHYNHNRSIDCNSLMVCFKKVQSVEYSSAIQYNSFKLDFSIFFVYTLAADISFRSTNPLTTAVVSLQVRCPDYFGYINHWKFHADKRNRIRDIKLAVYTGNSVYYLLYKRSGQWKATSLIETFTRSSRAI